MAIAFDTAVDSGATGANTSISWTHTCTGTNLILWVGVRASSDVVTGVTYNSVAMTQAIKKQGTGSNTGFVYLYYLIAPATGANTVQISASGSSTLKGASSSYTGAAQTGQPDNTASGVANSNVANADFSTAITTVADNCWAVMYNQRTFTGVTEADGATGKFRAGNTSNITTGFGDSNGATTPAGSVSVPLRCNNGTQDVTMVTASFSPAVVVASGHQKNINTLGAG